MFEFEIRDLKKLKQEFVDKRRKSYDSAVIDATAHVLLEMGNSNEMLRVAIDYLARQLSPCRIDAGLGSPQATSWHPEVDWLSPASDAPSTMGFSLPNQDQIVQTVWKSSQPVLLQDCSNHASLRTTKEMLEMARTKSMMAVRLQWSDSNLGIVCVDQTTHDRAWNIKEQQIFHEFCNDFLSPLLYRTVRRASTSDLGQPSQAEMDAIRLAAAGLSYKQIAKRLGKSVRTVEHQFRSARQKMQANNQTDLVIKCGQWI